tara:strand:+ start:384 stop:500 length:117 start_codon:yes stop_codon:yes gene_type:complete
LNKFALTLFKFEPTATSNEPEPNIGKDAVNSDFAIPLF